MPAVVSAWLVGSITIPLQTWTFDGASASIAAGTYYLRHPTAARSLIDLFDAANLAATPTTITSTTTLRQNRHVRVTRSSAAALTWGAATILRDLLGFTGNLASGTSSDADNISPLLWSPGYPGTPSTVIGIDGYVKKHESVFKSDDGTRQRRVRYGTEKWQELAWDHIVPTRLQAVGSVAAGGGTFHEWLEQSASLGYHFYHYEQVTEDTGSTSAVSWPTPLGPYVLRPSFEPKWYRRKVAADISSPLELPLHLVSEYA